MNEDHEQRVAEAKAFRKFAKNELERTKESAGTYPDVKVGDVLYEFEAGDELFYSEFVVIGTYTNGHCIVVEVADDDIPRPAKFAYEGLSRSLRGAMERAITWDLKYYTLKARLAESYLALLNSHSDPIAAQAAMRALEKAEQKKWDEENEQKFAPTKD